MAIGKKFMINNSKLRYILTVDGLDYYSFKPSFRHWFFEDWDGYIEDKEKHSIRQRVRMFIEWILGGYCIYYAGKSESLLGYVLVARGGHRITCSDKKDVVLGPYYTLTAKRGHGIMQRILNAALHDLPIVYENAYCYIKKDNIASIRAASKCRFQIYGQAEMRGMLRKLYLSNSENSLFYILKYNNDMSCN